MVIEENDLLGSFSCTAAVAMWLGSWRFALNVLGSNRRVVELLSEMGRAWSSTLLVSVFQIRHFTASGHQFRGHLGAEQEVAQLHDREPRGIRIQIQHLPPRQGAASEGSPKATEAVS